jgi:hypothetical protein
MITIMNKKLFAISVATKDRVGDLRHIASYGRASNYNEMLGAAIVAAKKANPDCTVSVNVSEIPKKYFCELLEGE